MNTTNNALAKLGLVLGGVILLTVPCAQGQVVNSCTDPYWRDSLRCLTNPVASPQPSPPPPANVSAIRQYTQFPLSDFNLRCADGTRPLLYIDQAVGGPSNNWLITFTGGAKCSAKDTNSDGDYDNGQLCLDRYFGGEAATMGTAFEPAMKNLGVDPNTSTGIHNPSPTENPVFANYHRVRVEKCSWDQHNGRVTHAGLAGVDGGGREVEYSLYQHGNLIAHRALAELRGNVSTGQGISYPTWVNENGQVVQRTERLPALEQAETVLVMGHSGSAHGLIHNIDGFAERLRSWPGFTGDVRTVLDASFQLAAENEVSFDSTQSGDLYDHVYAGNTHEAGNYDGEVYWDGRYARELEAWMADPDDPLDAMFDASCVAAHQAAGDDWKCRDRHHVLFNHLTTPFFIREDFNDPVVSHTLGGEGHIAEWGELGNYSHCNLVFANPCPPLIPIGNPSPYRNRSYQQTLTVAADITTRSELALGVDSSGSAPSTFFWMPDCGLHNGAYDNISFNTQEIVGQGVRTTYRELLEAFVTAPSTGAVAMRIDGLDGVSVCRGTLFADGFE